MEKSREGSGRKGELLGYIYQKKREKCRPGGSLFAMPSNEQNRANLTMMCNARGGRGGKRLKKVRVVRGKRNHRGPAIRVLGSPKGKSKTAGEERKDFLEISM